MPCIMLYSPLEANKHQSLYLSIYISLSLYLLPNIVQVSWTTFLTRRYEYKKTVKERYWNMQQSSNMYNGLGMA